MIQKGTVPNCTIFYLCCMYRTMNQYLAGIFPGRVIKVAVNAGLDVPIWADAYTATTLRSILVMPHMMIQGALRHNLKKVFGSTAARVTATAI